MSTRAAVLLSLLLAACASDPAQRPRYRIHIPAEQPVPAAPLTPVTPEVLPDARTETRMLAVAVLTACGGDSVQEFHARLRELAQVWPRWRPEDDFAQVAADPVRLLDDAGLDLRSDRAIHERYFARVPGDPRAACRAMARPR